MERLGKPRHRREDRRLSERGSEQIKSWDLNQRCLDAARHDKKHMNFLQSLTKQFARKPIDWDELEEVLIRADLGVPMTMRIIKTLQEREAWALVGIGDVIKAVREEIGRIVPRDPAPIRREPGKPTVILVVGVNGTGKTTSTAKLAR